MSNEDLRQQIWEHAEGREASPELQQALRESAQLRAELELARKHAGKLRQALAGVRPDQADYARLQALIVASLPDQARTSWRVALAIAASITIVLAGLATFWLVLNAGPDRTVDLAANAPKNPRPVKSRQWNVERFSPSATESMEVPMRLEQQLAYGSVLQLGQQEYAKVSESTSGAAWLAYPGTKLTTKDALELERGAVELQSAQRDGAEVRAAGRSFSSRANFSVSVEGPATLVCVYSGTVTKSDGNQSETLVTGRHELGGRLPYAGTEALSAYVKGFEAWRVKDYAAARAQFGAAANAAQPDETSRRIAHFYWFAAAGCEGDKKAAIGIGEAYVNAYGQDATVPYVRFFLGKYLLELGEREQGRLHLSSVAATGSEQLRKLAQNLIDQLDGAKATTAQALWETFIREWQQQNYAACEKAMISLLRDCPTDASVTSGEASFRLFCAVGNQARLEEAVVLADEFLRTYPQHKAADYVLYFKASYQSQLGKRDAALETLARLEQDYPESSMRRFALALRDELQARK